MIDQLLSVASEGFFVSESGLDFGNSTKHAKATLFVLGMAASQLVAASKEEFCPLRSALLRLQSTQLST